MACSRILAALFLAAHLSTFAGEPTPLARLVTEDAKTQGDWPASYGADGGTIFGDKAFLPGYVQVTQGGQFHLWNATPDEPGALYKKSAEDERVAGCFYDKQFTIDLMLKDGEHRVALYFIDYNKKGRKQKVEILNGKTGSVLQTRSLVDFENGKYLVYDMAGQIKVRLTVEAGDSAAISGIFFGKNARTGPRKAVVEGAIPEKPGIHKLKFIATVGGKKIMVPYAVHLPPGYDTNKTPHPCVVFLHGAGEGGTDLNAVFNTGTPADMRNNPKIMEALKFVGFYPQTTMGWDPPMTTATIQALDDFMSKFRIDKDRLYCTGLSMGGRGTWVLAQEGAPRFAALAPMDPFGYKPEVAQKVLKDTAAWIIVGSQDGDHTLGSRDMYKKLKEVDANVYLTVVPNCGHGAWGMFMPKMETYEWLLKHKRGSKERYELPSIGVLEDPVEKFKKQALKAPPNNGNEGSILCRYWRGVNGGAISDLTNNEDFPDFPSEIYFMTKFETPPDLDDNYGCMMNGYIVPPDTGEYTFWIASDDGSELFLSDSDSEAGRASISKCEPYTNHGNWDFNAAQKSKKIKLEKGKRYYIEALTKEGGGQDFCMVGWQLPNGTMERPIPGNRLVPYIPKKRAAPTPPKVTLLDDISKFQKPGMHKLKSVIQFDRQKIEMSYCLYLPKDYDAKRPEGFPMFTFLHGAGHQGSDWVGLLNEGPPQMLQNDAKLREQMTLAGFFPQAPGDKRWDNRAIIQATVALLVEVSKNFNIDKDRVYCTGLSMGGMGTWFVAQEAPWLFAAIAPISAVAVRLERAPDRLKDVPTWIICGSNDGGFTDGSVKMYDAFKSNGNVVKLDNVQGEGHGVWGRYYPKMEFYNWLLQHKRKPKVPSPVVAVVAAPVAPPVAPPVVAVVPVPAAVNPPPVIVNPPAVPPVTPAPTLTIGPKVVAVEPAKVVPAPVTPAPVVTSPASAAPAPIAVAPGARRKHVPYAQIMLCLSGLLFLLAFYFLIDDEQEKRTRGARG